MLDVIKYVIAIALALAGVVAYDVLSAQPTVLRVLAVLAGVAAGVAVAAFTASGKRFVELAQASVNEAKKVVWPDKRETLQTTGIVFVFVLVMAIVLWITDKSIEWVLYDLILRSKL